MVQSSGMLDTGSGLCAGSRDKASEMCMLEPLEYFTSKV